MTRLSTVIFLSMGAFLVISGDAFAATTDSFGGSTEIAQQATVIQNFLFGAPMKVAAALGGAYGAVQAIMGNFQRMLMYAGAALSVLVVPKFIDGIFSVASALLP
jgi:hypothetical protein